MIRTLMLTAALTWASAGSVAAQDAGPTDAQIAHIAYTAGLLDVAAGEQALQKSTNPAVRAFAEVMVRDHRAVNDLALALVGRLNVTPEANPISASLSEQAAATHMRLAQLEGAAFDRAYVANEVAYHGTVNGALRTALIPSADNGELRALLETGLTLFQQHQVHAEHLALEVR